MAVGQASNGLDEYGYDAHSDTTACYLGRPIQHLTHFSGDTLRLKNGCPSPYQGYHKWQGFTISDFYVTQDTASFKGMHAAILSPVTMTLMQDSLQDSLFTDRLLIISCEGKCWVYPYFIRNTEASTIMFKEDLAADEDGITLNYEAGNGWKYSYTITIGVCWGTLPARIGGFRTFSRCRISVGSRLLLWKRLRMLPRQPLPARLPHAAQGRRHQQVLR